MIKYLFLFLPILAYGQSIPYTLDLVEINPDTEIKIPFNGKGPWKEIVVHRTNYDTAASYELVVTLKKKTVVTPLPDLVTNIDNVTSDTKNKYTGSWTHASAQPWLSSFNGNTGSYTFTSGAILETTFEGYKIEWYTEKRVNHGIAGVSIDGGAEVEVDLYNSTTTNNSQLAWTSPALNPGAHTIKIRFLGKKNPLATETTIIHDYFKVFKAQ